MSVHLFDLSYRNEMVYKNDNNLPADRLPHRNQEILRLLRVGTRTVLIYWTSSGSSQSGRAE